MAERFVYRGTCPGWPGSGPVQSVRMTPVTTDPLVATLFALECLRHGPSVVHLASKGSVAQIIGCGNRFADLECEIGLAVTPLDFAANHTRCCLPVEVARSILHDLGFPLPVVISSKRWLQIELQTSARLTDTEIVEFDRQAMR